MSLALKPTHATVKAYYETLHQYGQLHIDHEGAVRSAFQELLAKSGRKAKPQLTLVPEYRIERRGSSVIVDGALVDLYHLPHGYWLQCFPFYTYAEDGTHRRENITDWALEQFRARYHDPSISKWDIFHYIYAVLHHPEYRERYAANLRRELPRIPFVGNSSFAPANTRSLDSARDDGVKSGMEDDADLRSFRAFVKAGERLAEIHVHYEQQAEYPLTKTEKAGEKLDWRVTKMRLSKDKTSLIYNQFLTLSGIPPETYGYRLGNRSALEWVIDQYQVSTDKRSGITNDPNRDDDKEYILRLVGQVIAVSLETVRLVNELPALGIVGTSER
jgi:predicted helicase